MWKSVAITVLLVCLVAAANPPKTKFGVPHARLASDLVRADHLQRRVELRGGGSFPFQHDEKVKVKVLFSDEEGNAVVEIDARAC